MTITEIILVILISISIVGLAVLIILLVGKNKKSEELKQNDQPIQQVLDLKEIGALQKQLELMGPQLKNDIELAVNKEMNNISDKNAKNAELQNEKLLQFQTAISESINQRFDGLNRQMDEKLKEMNEKVDQKLQEGFKGTSETMTQVRERLQAIDAAQRNIEDLSKDVVSLKNVLEGNQSRGQYGEYQLSMVLHNVFGDTTGCYEEQYTMKKVKDGDDVRADAVVFMPEPNKMICIDSKFPFKDYERVLSAESDDDKERLTKDFAAAVKKHITAIKDKYIVEGKTAPEALMFIPNDGVFAFIHQHCEDVVENARERKVILTSPSTLPAILVTINMVRIEVERAKNVEIINKQLAKLSKDFELFGRDWDMFSNALERTTKQREKLDTRVGKITTKFAAIKGSSGLEIEDEEPELIEEQE